MKLELINCPSGDWQVLKVDGVIIYQGHHIPDYEWLGILANFCHVKKTEISDEDMEAGTYYGTE
jgi:hypothetical protein